MGTIDLPRMVPRVHHALVEARSGRPRQAALDLDDMAHEAAEAGDMAGRVYALATLAHVLSLTSEHSRAERIARDAVMFAQQIQNNEILALALAAQSLVINRTHFGEAATSAFHAERLARGGHDAFIQMEVFTALSDLYSRCGAFEEALAVGRELLAVARATGEPMSIATALSAIATDLTTLALAAGMGPGRDTLFADARATLNEALLVNQSAQSGYAHALCLLQLGLIEAAHQDYAAASASANDAVALAGRVGARGLVGKAQSLLARIHLMQGNAVTASDLATDVLSQAISTDQREVKILALAVLADASQELGDFESAARALRRIHELGGAERAATRELVIQMRDSHGEQERAHVELRERRSEVTELREAATELARRTEALIEAGQRDTLTRLPSRSRADEVLPQLMDAARFAHQPFALAIVDIDRLRAVNESLGPTAGDRVLQRVADLTRQQLRESDFAARYGGDEIVMLLPRVGGADQARQVAERVVYAVARADWSDIAPSLRVGVNVGIALLSGPDSPETLRARAEQALIGSRQDGVDHVRVAPALDW
jgi:diguanylate cyclase (GGDEF)-like protein